MGGGGIFVCYRRDDASGDARGIYDALVVKFGERGVFMDTRLSAGQEFDAVIASELERCDVLIAVIGKHWLEILRKRTASSEEDLLRREVETALKRRLIVIPVSIDDAAIPAREQLPEDMRRLVLLEKQGIRHKTFARDVEDLVEAIHARRKERLSGPRQFLARIAISVIVPPLAGLLTFVMLAIINDLTSIIIETSAMKMAVSVSIILSLGLVLSLVWRKN